MQTSVCTLRISAIHRSVMHMSVFVIQMSVCDSYKGQSEVRKLLAVRRPSEADCFARDP